MAGGAGRVEEVLDALDEGDDSVRPVSVPDLVSVDVDRRGQQVTERAAEGEEPRGVHRVAVRRGAVGAHAAVRPLGLPGPLGARASVEPGVAHETRLVATPVHRRVGVGVRREHELVAAVGHEEVIARVLGQPPGGHALDVRQRHRPADADHRAARRRAVAQRQARGRPGESRGQLDVHRVAHRPHVRVDQGVVADALEGAGTIGQRDPVVGDPGLGAGEGREQGGREEGCENEPAPQRLACVQFRFRSTELIRIDLDGCLERIENVRGAHLPCQTGSALPGPSGPFRVTGR